jgi:hypothetical protein
MNDKPANGGDPRIALAQVQAELGRYGLKGTLYGAWAFAFLFLVIAVVQLWTDRYVVQGGWFVAMVAIVAVCVALYGAFVFNKSLSLSAKIGETAFGAETSRIPTQCPKCGTSLKS